MHVEALSSMFLRELKHVFHFWPNVARYVGVNDGSNMYVLDGQEHWTEVQPDPESLAANVLMEAGLSTTQLPFSS